MFYFFIVSTLGPIWNSTYVEFQLASLNLQVGPQSGIIIVWNRPADRPADCPAARRPAERLAKVLSCISSFTDQILTKLQNKIYGIICNRWQLSWGHLSMQHLSWSNFGQENLLDQNCYPNFFTNQLFIYLKLFLTSIFLHPNLWMQNYLGSEFFKPQFADPKYLPQNCFVSKTFLDS